MQEVENNKFTVVDSQSFNDKITNQLNILKEKDARIITLMTLLQGN